MASRLAAMSNPLHQTSRAHQAVGLSQLTSLVLVFQKYTASSAPVLFGFVTSFQPTRRHDHPNKNAPAQTVSPSTHPAQSHTVQHTGPAYYACTDSIVCDGRSLVDTLGLRVGDVKVGSASAMLRGGKGQRCQGQPDGRAFADPIFCATTGTMKSESGSGSNALLRDTCILADSQDWGQVAVVGQYGRGKH